MTPSLRVFLFFLIVVCVGVVVFYIDLVVVFVIVILSIDFDSSFGYEISLNHGSFVDNLFEGRGKLDLKVKAHFLLSFITNIITNYFLGMGHGSLLEKILHHCKKVMKDSPFLCLVLQQSIMDTSCSKL